MAVPGLVYEMNFSMHDLDQLPIDDVQNPFCSSNFYHSCIQTHSILTKLRSSNSRAYWRKCLFPSFAHSFDLNRLICCIWLLSSSEFGIGNPNDNLSQAWALTYLCCFILMMTLVVKRLRCIFTTPQGGGSISHCELRELGGVRPACSWAVFNWCAVNVGFTVGSAEIGPVSRGNSCFAFARWPFPWA